MPSLLFLERCRPAARHCFGPALAQTWPPRHAIAKELYSTTNDETTTTDQASTIGSAGGDEVDMDSQLLYQQFKDLSLEIRKHDELYYGTATSSGQSPDSDGPVLLSDDEFDALVRREEELETKYPDLLRTWQQESGLGQAATRSGRVGARDNTNHGNHNPNQSLFSDEFTSSGRLKRKHLTPMLSLDNVHSEEQLQTWLKRVVKAATVEPHETSRVTIVTEPKLDGVSLSLRYKSSSPSGKSFDKKHRRIALELQWASTRGDGSVGQDVTAAAKQISGIPRTIYLPLEDGTPLQPGGITVEVRGEVVMPRSEFLKLQQEAASKQKEEQEKLEIVEELEKGGDVSSEDKNTSSNSIISFSNPRNAASGILLRKESDDLQEQAQSKELRSLLRFYAYDLSGLETIQEGGDGSELDGIQLRNQLSEWNFPLAMPVEITEMEWENYNVHSDDDDDDEEEEDSKPSWDAWFHKTIVGDPIRPILDYFSALEDHRERLQEEDKGMAPLPTSKKKSKSSSNYEWGDFDVDGCVHKVTQASLRSAMGYSMKSPKWATAHKFPAQSSVARLLDVVVQVGRTGAITPVAILEPTEVGGVTVQRATLHNFGHMQEVLGSHASNEKTDVEAKIPKYEPLLVQRAGDVIPQVVRRIHQSDDSFATDDWISLDAPTECPACGSPVSCESSSSSSSAVGQVLRCTGPPLLCPPRAVTSLKHAYSRDALDLTGLSEARIQQLMDADLLNVPSDVFRMQDAEWETLQGLPGWGERSCQNLKSSCEKVASRGIGLGRFIYSLGIRHLGKHTSELVAGCFGSVGAFLEALDAAAGHEINEDSNRHQEGEEKEESEDASSTLPNHPFSQLEAQPGIGPVVVDSLLEFAKSKELTDATKLLAESLTILEEDIIVMGKEDSGIGDSSDGNTDTLPWKGFRVVFTGSLREMSRSKAQEIAKLLGAKATPGSVSKATDLVVFGEKGGKKLTQARELGISTMEAQEFLELASEQGLLNEDADDR